MNTFPDIYEAKRKIRKILEWASAIVIVGSICYIVMHIVLAVKLGVFK